MPHDEGAHRAAAEVARSALRWFEGDPGAETDHAEGRGWFRGARDCAHYLAMVSGAPIATACAFGGEWPVVKGKDWLLAPALPLVLSVPGGEGVDGAYSVRGGSVWREASGVEQLFLTDAGEPSPGADFDLLWFGDRERYVVRRGVLTVEDLFASLELPVDHGTLERILVRGRRVEAAVLDGLGFERPDGAAKITTSRATTPATGERWRDPERFLRARADIDRTDRHGERVETMTVHGNPVCFLCEERPDGWVLRLDRGDYPLTCFSMQKIGPTLSISADLHPTLDALAPGMRGRLAFDLRSDLVTLG